MNVRSVLYDAQGTLRAPWRLAVFFIVFSVATVLFSALATAAFGLGPESGTVPFGQFVFAWATLLALIVAHVASIRWVERRPWGDFGLGAPDARPRPLVLGALLGGLAIGVPGALLYAMGWLDAMPGSDGSWWDTAVVLGLLFAPAALAEELLFRGYPFAVLKGVAGSAIAVVGTSVLFALVHLPNATVMADTSALGQGILAVFLAGIFLGSVVLVTGSVYAAWAAHFAWNYVLGAIMRSPVSGISVPVTKYQLIDAGPDWATGGGWGPEGGAGATLGMVVALAILYGLSRRARDQRTMGASGPGAAAA